MTTADWALLLSILMPLLLGILDYKNKRAEAKKKEAEALETQTKTDKLKQELNEGVLRTAQSAIDAQHTLQQEINDMRTSMNAMQDALQELPRLMGRITEFERGVGLLIAQIRLLGHEPVWTIPDELKTKK